MNNYRIRNTTELKNIQYLEIRGKDVGRLRPCNLQVSRTFFSELNPLSATPTKWSNTLKTIRREKPTHCLSVCEYFVGLALKGLQN